ncbi:hypothetical protein [Kribbella albertanoniae]|uniref:Uncharacterized protein n=1 Tax=Kribbella albertanoniae TaxID=1266829 RepID=A0A4R4PM19_9ACTN|nr:hypothetical protein [Kribbella albertanoniae]TDC23190.1 hypothetical protein E1261_29020 [Kribbella albertanoniae]
MSSRDLNEWAVVLDARSDDEAVNALLDLMNLVIEAHEATKVLARSLVVLPEGVNARQAAVALEDAYATLQAATKSFHRHERGL